MGKGIKGESCPEARRKVISQGEIVSFSELFSRVRPMGLWKDNRIWQALMASVVNLPPARRWWPIEPFLFLHDDGRVSLYDASVHPKTVD